MASTATRPQTRATRAVLDSLTSALRAEVQEAHAEYRQYDGHWDNWTVVEVMRQIRIRGGVAFEAGQLVLRKPGEESDTPGFATCYSRQNQINTSVELSLLREIFIEGECQRCGQRVVPGNEIPDPELECPTVRRPKPKPRVKATAR